MPSRNMNTTVYQIDFSAVAAGKRLASTKRRIRWYVKFQSTSIFSPRHSTNETSSLLFRINFCSNNSLSHDQFFSYLGALGTQTTRLWPKEGLGRTVVARNMKSPLCGQLPRANARWSWMERRSTIRRTEPVCWNIRGQAGATMCSR